MFKSKLKTLALAAALLLCQATAYGANVSISIDHPGGNILVGEKSGSTINIAPDLRGGRDWFYWNFDATADGPGEVTFKFKGTKIGPQGPSYSTDGGKTWQWLGPEGASGSEFVYNFEKKGQTVRFAVGIPYLLENLNEFLDKHKNNPLLKQSVLTKTRKGRNVPLLQIGEPGPGKKAIILTGRHHACEAMVSYALEGFLGELLSDSYTSREFLKQYVVYSVPMVDLDGVEDGDQGKNRPPHDHNRDYIPGGNLYPETTAIMKLADEKKIQFAMDFHCPALRGDVHYAFYYDGPKFDHTASNMEEMRAWQAEEGPMQAAGALNFMKPITGNRTPMNSDFFGYREDVINAATIEVPYSRPGTKMTEDLVRKYGVSMLKAWLHTQFSRDANIDRGENSIKSLLAFRAELGRSLGNPAKVQELTKPYLSNPNAHALYRVESNLGLAGLALRQKDYAAFTKYNDLALNDPAATTRQRINAKLNKLDLALATAGNDGNKVQAAIDDAFEIPYLGKGDLNSIYTSAMNYYKSHKMLEQAIKYTELQAEVGLDYKLGSVKMEVADMYDALGKPKEAAAKRLEAVRTLQRMLDPVTKYGPGPIMAADLVRALDLVPSSTKEEMIAALTIAVEHPLTSPAAKAEFQKRLDSLK